MHQKSKRASISGCHWLSGPGSGSLWTVGASVLGTPPGVVIMFGGNTHDGT